MSFDPSPRLSMPARMPCPAPLPQVPSSVLLAMQQLFVKHAQQFGGYMFGSDALTDRRGYFSFGFGCPSNALRFCHTVQVRHAPGPAS